MDKIISAQDLAKAAMQPEADIRLMLGNEAVARGARVVVHAENDDSAGFHRLVAKHPHAGFFHESHGAIYVVVILMVASDGENSVFCLDLPPSCLLTALTNRPRRLPWPT